MPIKTIDNLCRICVQESGAYMHIYDQSILDIRLSEVIKDLCQLNLQAGDGLPEYVCQSCHSKVVEFHKFKQMSHEGATALLSIKKKLDEITIEEMELPLEKVEDVKPCQAEEEWNDQHLTVDAINQLLEVQIKEEPEDSMIPNVPDDIMMASVKTESVENDVDEEKHCGIEQDIKSPGGSLNNQAKDAPVIGSDSTQVSLRTEPMKLKKVVGVTSSQSYMILRIGDKEKQGKEGGEPSGSGESAVGKLQKVLLVPVESETNGIGFAPCGTEGQTRESPSSLAGKGPDCAGARAGSQRCDAHVVRTAHQGHRSGRRNRLPAEFKCDGCGCEFRTKISIVYHLKVPETANAYNCVECGVNFRNRCAYDHHPCVSEGPPEKRVRRKRLDKGMEFTTKPRGKRFSCVICSRAFPQRWLLKAHEMTHTVDERGFKCEICGQVFKNRGNLTMHRLLHAGDKPYACKVCGRSFSRKHHLRLHMVTHVGAMAVTCSVCSMTFTDRSELGQHMLSHTVDKPHSCAECPESFSDLAQLERHKVSVHSAEEVFRCKLCPDTFAERSAMAKHMAGHNQDKPHVCEVCFRAYTQRGHLNEHMLNHSGMRPFACEICSKAFVRRSTLSHHMRMHKTERKTHPCTLCAKTFTEKSSLNKHMLLHTGEKPYSCSVCQRPFRQKNNLDVHMRLHTGKKRYTCGVCARSFSSRSNLTQHMLMHTSIAAFKCHQCPYVFKTQAQLDKHLRVHIVMVQGRGGCA
ncbi:zinc finger protein 502-like [Ischnura elegans]|uniref:zinc finger protein 502-like n=1 Tax=Ischnura elegans TaxID=197161 RepID=UPI001ED882A8|nr:zinc finger protein 502-like [Ischnura elegans]